jgi:hypothetical protein
MNLACDQENTHGMARRSATRRLDPRDGGREPIFRSAISAIGVALQKKASNAGSS